MSLNTTLARPDLTPTTQAQKTRATRRPASQRSPASPRSEAKKKVWFYLSPDAIRRLGVAASMEDSDRSAIVENLIQGGLKRWVVQDRSRPAAQTLTVAGIDGDPTAD